MCREPGWNDTLLVAKPADPPNSGIGNPHSSQWCLLVPGKPASTLSGAHTPDLSTSRPPRTTTDRWLRLCQQEASVLGGSCRPYKDLLALRRNNAFIPATCFFALLGDRVAPMPTRHRVIEIPPTQIQGR